MTWNLCAHKFQSREVVQCEMQFACFRLCLSLCYFTKLVTSYAITDALCAALSGNMLKARAEIYINIITIAYCCCLIWDYSPISQNMNISDVNNTDHLVTMQVHPIMAMPLTQNCGLPSRTMRPDIPQKLRRNKFRNTTKCCLGFKFPRSQSDRASVGCIGIISNPHIQRCRASTTNIPVPDITKGLTTMPWQVRDVKAAQGEPAQYHMGGFNVIADRYISSQIWLSCFFLIYLFLCLKAALQ